MPKTGQRIADEYHPWTLDPPSEWLEFASHARLQAGNVITEDDHERMGTRKDVAGNANCRSCVSVE